MRTRYPVEEDRNGYSIAQIAAIAGMSARNIRAHQARGLLWPPARRGRVAVYGDRHVERLRLINRLQADGFNLASIRSVIASMDARADADGEVAARVISLHRPALVQELCAAGVIGYDALGVLRVEHPRAVQCALDLERFGVPAEQALGLLRRAVDALRPAVRSSTEATRHLARARDGRGPRRASVPCPHGWADALSSVLVEAFRVALELEQRRADESVTTTGTGAHSSDCTI